LIRFVGIDLDGTLLDSQKHISQENLEAIYEMERDNIMVTFFTGRAWVAAKDYLSSISFDIPGVFQNGAYIATVKSHKVLRKIVLDHETAINVVKASRKYGLFFVLFTNFTDFPDMVIESELPRSSKYVPYFDRNSYRIFKVKDVTRCIGEYVSEVAVVGSIKAIEKMNSELDLSNSTVILNTLLGEEGFVEFFGRECGKEKAMDFLLKRFEIKPEEASFIGDNYNDLKVLKKVGHPIVMGNAPDTLKKVARFITSTNDENGVAVAVREYISKNI